MFGAIKLASRDNERRNAIYRPSFIARSSGGPCCGGNQLHCPVSMPHVQLFVRFLGILTPTRFLHKYLCVISRGKYTRNRFLSFYPSLGRMALLIILIYKEKIFSHVNQQLYDLYNILYTELKVANRFFPFYTYM